MNQDDTDDFTLRYLSDNHQQARRAVNPVVFSAYAPSFPSDFFAATTIDWHRLMTGDDTPLPKDSALFVLGELIGSGSFARVYKAVDKKTNQTIAIKAYRTRKKDSTTHLLRAVTEMAFLRLLDHPNIIGYILSDITMEYMCLGIEYSAHGSLGSFMKKTGSFSEISIQATMRQLLSAVSYIHSMSIFHGDIKPENIIVYSIQDNHLRLKLTDFGLADVIINPNGNLKKAGSFYYMAPELHLGFPSDHTSDLYSAGVVMYELLYGRKPFSTKITRDVYVSNLRRRVDINFSELESMLFSDECINLVKNLLSYDKSERLSGEALAKHPFLNIVLVKDKQNHYFKASEGLLKCEEYVKKSEYSLAYMELTEAIIHLKIHLNNIRANQDLYTYTKCKIQEYTQYADKIEEKMKNGRNTDVLNMPFNGERLRCMLKSTPVLLNAYDICAIGEMYYTQHNMQQGSMKIREGLSILFPMMGHEPEGLRKQLLTTKMEQWVKMLEDMKKAMERVPGNR